MEDNLMPPVKMPVPAFNAADVAFGAQERDYLTREQLGDWYGLYGKNSRTPFHACVEGLFNRGGKLADYGLSIKPDLDSKAVMMAVRALMASWAPKHEIKVGTVAVALANWCDISKAEGQ